LDKPIEIETGPHPSASIIVLHGLGADGTDFVPVCQALDLSRLGAVRYVLPHAPLRSVTVNGGHVMRAWYDIAPPGPDGTRREDAAGLSASRAMVDTLIAGERARGISSRRIVIAGFSQGCAMALMAGVRHPQRLAGIAGMSGYLPLASATAAEAAPENRDTPIFLAHGLDDPVVALARGAASRDHLRTLGWNVSWHEYPIEHTVSLEEIQDLEGWLHACLAP
jgi:phospholipase/carboxylesterase